MLSLQSTWDIRHDFTIFVRQSNNPSYSISCLKHSFIVLFYLHKAAQIIPEDTHTVSLQLTIIVCQYLRLM